jgi:adenylate kinase
MRLKQLVDDSIMNGLIQNRLSQVDCQMQGYVLEGYPKTSNQSKALSDTHMKPSMIVTISGGSLNGQVSK